MHLTVLFCSVLAATGAALRGSLPSADAECGIDPSSRADCYPFDVATPEACAARSCCWHPSDSAPWCFHPKASAPPVAACAASPIALRLDCWPKSPPHATPETCAARGCCWTPVGEEGAGANVPWCHHPGGTGGYAVESLGEWQPFARTARVSLTAGSRAGPSAQDPKSLDVRIDAVAPRTSRLRVSDAASDGAARWSLAETPLGIPRAFEPLPEDTALESSAEIAPVGDPFSVTFSRADAPAPFARIVSPLLLEPQLVEFTLELPRTTTIHGLGEAVAPWALSANQSAGGRVHTIFSRDRGTPDAGPNGNANLYGAHAFALFIDSDGAAGGIWAATPVAMDVTLHGEHDET